MDTSRRRVSVWVLSLLTVAGGFAFIILAHDNPRGCVFYLDQMAFETFAPAGPWRLP